MTNLKRSSFQAHPFHLVSPSPWPLFTCISLLTLTTSGVLTMHAFAKAEYFLFLALISVILSMSLWWRDVISEGTYLGNHTLSVQKGLNMGVALFIVSEAFFFLAIFWAYFHRAMWIETKLRGHPKALITKLYEETYKVALLMIKGIVISLEIIGASRWMGNRGSKSDSYISVKEQRVDGFSTSSCCRKVYSKCQGNLVIMHKYHNVVYKINTFQNKCVFFIAFFFINIISNNINKKNQKIPKFFFLVNLLHIS